MITADTKIEDLVWKYPETVQFLLRYNLPCVVCGEPFWGSLRELCKQKNFSDEQIQKLVDDFNAEHPDESD